jgi:hypothetical protein
MDTHRSAVAARARALAVRLPFVPACALAGRAFALAVALALVAPVALAALTAPTAPAAAVAQAPLPSLRWPTPVVSGESTGTSIRVPASWRTKAESTGYRDTPDYDETMRYVRRLEAASRWIKVVSFGTSSQGRDLPLIIVSKDRAFTPETALALAKPIVLIQNGIHSGEIEGKDACLALVRDMAVLHTRAELLDSTIVLVIPILSVDAHERHGPYNRINQNGPSEMGWRANPVGLNLNRDYLKVETVEIRALLTQIYTRWWPHLLIDDHTTDGADYRHDVTYSTPHGAGTPGPVDRWIAEAFEGRVVPRLTAMGHLPAPYLSFRGWSTDPRAGVDYDNAPPRFSHGYPPIQNRAGLLVETHMIKPYGARVKATYDLLVAVLEELHARPRALVDAVARADAQTVARGRESDPARREVVLTTKVGDKVEPFPFKGWVTRWEKSDVIGVPLPRYSDAPWDTIIPLRRDVLPRLTVRQPVGYLVPQEWTIARDRMDVHGVRYRRFVKAWTDTVEVQHVIAWRPANEEREGHRTTTVSRAVLERRLRTYRPGDLWVPLDQRSALVAVHLFEAQAPDGLTYWNAFDTVFEHKEYGEAYVVEPLARRMMDADPVLAKAFRDSVARDSTFAKDPQARSEFFYRRSPWADPEQNLLPVTRALRRPPETVLEQ